jgi:hypothetical protein
MVSVSSGLPLYKSCNEMGSVTVKSKNDEILQLVSKKNLCGVCTRGFELPFFFVCSFLKGVFLHTRETTSCSSPSGRHYGLYRAGVQDEDLLHIHAGLAIQPFRYGFILDRWRNITQVMLKKTQVMLKKKPQPIYNSFRIIEIFEGDFSAISSVGLYTTNGIRCIRDNNT